MTKMSTNFQLSIDVYVTNIISRVLDGCELTVTAS